MISYYLKPNSRLITMWFVRFVAIENPQLVSNLEAIRGSKSNNLVKKLIKYPLKKILAVKKNLGK